MRFVVNFHFGSCTILLGGHWLEVLILGFVVAGFVMLVRDFIVWGVLC